MSELWDHQKRLLELTEHKNEFALFWEMGTGKSRAVIEVLNKKMAKESRFLKTLIISPLSVISNWKDQLKQNGYVDDQLIVLNMSGPKRKQILSNGIFDSGLNPGYHGKKVVIINYEGIILKDLLDILTAWKPECLILDESHRAKSHQSKRSKIIYQLAKTAKYKFLLSGTPVLKDIGDLFQQFKILKDDIFGTNFWIFNNRYFFDKNVSWKSSQNYFPKWEPRPESVTEISAKIKPISMSIKKIECLDLPPLVKQVIYTEMSPEQKRVYEDMRREMISFLNEQKDVAAVATIALTKALRFMQITSGFVSTNGEPYIFKENPRIKILQDLLSDLTPNNKVIVWANFKINYKMIRECCERLDISSVEVHGDVPGQERENNIREFQQNDEVKILIGNQQSGGIGIDLTAASHSIYYSKNFSLESDLQSEARNYRPGSEKFNKITRLDLVTPGTIDELVNESLAKKLNVGDTVLKGLKSGNY